MTTATVRLTECPNCGAMLVGAFCAQCGQKTASLNPSFSEFLHDLFHELANFDGKIVKSVWLLLTRPGFLSREHFEGRRARYISPIRLYLVFSLLYFAVVAFAPMATMRVTWTPGPNDDPQEKELREQEMRKAITHWAPRAMFVLVPVFAGFVGLAARRSGRNYPQHPYFAMHVHAAWFFAGAVAASASVVTIPYLTSVMSGTANLYAVLYFVLAFRRAYNATLARAILRGAAVGGIYAIAVLVTLLAIVFPVVLRH